MSGEKRYCIYLRKSRADIELEARGEMETLARHRKTLLDVAKKMKLSVTEIYEEIVSGETIAARPVVQQLLDEVEQGEWSGVLVMEIERLARGDTIDQGIVAKAFKMGKANIITPTKTYDPTNEFDEEYFEFGLFMSRREYKAINRRIQRGRVASAKEGKFLGSTPPYGYEKIRIKDDKGYTLTPDANEAPIVKQIYGLYDKGFGMTAIARQLDNAGVKPRNTEVWSKTTIKTILTNPVYMGKLRWSHKRETRYYIDGKMHKRKTLNENPIYVDGLHPALISEETYKKAQDARKHNTHKKTKNNLALRNPLSGIVYCGKCGGLMTRLGANSRNKYDALRCLNRYCDNVSAPIFLVERKVIEILKKWLSQHKLSFEKKQLVPDNNGLAILEMSVKSLKDELKKINIQINNTFDLLEQGVYTVDVFKSRNEELSKRKAEIENEITATSNAIERENNNILMHKEKIPELEGILDTYFNIGNAEEKNRILRSVILKANYYKNTPNTRGKLENDNFELHIFPRMESET